MPLNPNPQAHNSAAQHIQPLYKSAIDLSLAKTFASFGNMNLKNGALH